MSTHSLQARYDQCYRLAEKIYPGPPASLAFRAAMMAGATEQIVNSSTTLEEFLGKVRGVELSCLNRASSNEKKELETTLAEYRYRKGLLLKQIASGAIPETESGNLNRANEAMIESIEEAKRVRAQTCQACKAKNYSSLTETGELKHFLKKCSGCKKALYCSQECQGADWKRHQVECLSSRP